MDTSLSEAFYGVFTSSKEIIQNEQTHLYCNMLELLKNTCSSTKLNTAKISQEDLAKFWLSDILPLVFDKNEKVQKNAIDAFEQYLSTFDISVWHKFPVWATVKSTILGEYIPEINKLRTAQSKYWHKIWCLLLRLFSREILKGAQVINSFLTVVEQGFRSTLTKMRTECYSCWHLLIHIFHTHGELTTPKRMKLVCIPLKSSSTRSLYPKLNVVKLHVWWYLLTCLENKISDYISEAFEPFLNFCLMVFEQCPNSALWPMLCLTALVSEQMDKHLMEDSGLEALSMPSPLLQSTELQNLMIKPTLKALKLGLDNPVIEEEMKQILLQKLILFLHKAMSDSLKNFTSIGAELHKCLCKYTQLYEYSLENLGTNSACMKKILAEQEDELEGTHAVIDLYEAAKPFVFDKCLKNFLLSVFQIENLSESEIGWKQIFVVSGDVLRILDDAAIKDMTLKMYIFQSISSNLPKIFSNQKTVAHNVHTPRLFKWIMWPLERDQNQVKEAIDIYCDANFVQIWSEIFKISLTWPGNKNIIATVGDILPEFVFFDVNRQKDLFVYFEIYLQAILEKPNEKGRRELPDILIKIISSAKIEQTVMEKCLKCITDFIFQMKENEIPTLFDDIKKMFNALIKQLNKFQSIKSTTDTWKGTILEKLRTAVEKQKFTQIKELFKEDVFVIIPSVWTLNPDKLTERQKERFSEKLDNIPELYNDMPVSTQQSPMKPWSPRKVVIACNNEMEISLPNIPESNDDLPRLDLAILENADKNEVSTTTPPLTRNRSAERNRESPRLSESPKKPNSSQKIAEQNRDSPTKPNSSQKIAERNRESPRLLDSPTKKTSPVKTNAKTHTLEEQITQSSAASAEILARNETSPKKNIPTFVLSSPPDRKGTNNSRSPTLRPKSTNHMTGRGAQLINMIRSRSIDVTRVASPLGSNPLSQKYDKLEFNTPRQSKMLINSAREQTQSTPSMELLIFSKSLPPPSASPSASILKRRIAQRDLEESDAQDLPASKRKRVSFHDPPVSVTKEYVRDAIEINRGKRCLDKQLNVSANIEQKILRRRNSCTEVDRLAINERHLETVFTLPKHLAYNSLQSPLSPTKSAMKKENTILRTPTLTPMDALKFALEKLPLDVILEQCLSEKMLPGKSAHTFTRLVSQCMDKDEVVKTKVLEKISEDHSKEILDFAIQENLSSVVCDRLNFNSVIEYVCQKIQVNAGCRNTLLKQLNKVLKGNESYEFIQNILQDYELTDKQIVDILSTLVQKRSHMEQNSTEKAPDSSTNL